MKHQAMLIKSPECFHCEVYVSPMKCFNNGIDKSQFPNMGITNFWSVQPCNCYMNSYFNYFNIVTRCLQPYNMVENIVNP